MVVGVPCGSLRWGVIKEDGKHPTTGNAKTGKRSGENVAKEVGDAAAIVFFQRFLAIDPVVKFFRE